MYAQKKKKEKKRSPVFYRKNKSNVLLVDLPIFSTTFMLEFVSHSNPGIIDALAELVLLCDSDECYVQHITVALVNQST